MTSGYYTCADHPSQEAVTNCRKCGKPICNDCCEVFRIGAGMYAGEVVCYDCSSEMVAENIANIDRFRAQVKKERTAMFAGMAVGAVIGMMAGASTNSAGGIIGMMLLFIAIGGSIGTIASKTLDYMASFGLFGLLATVAMIWVSPIMTIYRFFNRIRQIQQCNEIIANDSNTLREMRDYYAYTQIMEERRGRIDLEKLASQGGELFNNSYARAVVNVGEAAAQTELRQSVVTISANGEIIRNFAAVRG